MPKPDKDTARWAARKAREVAQPPDDEAAARLRILDALRAAFRVNVAGVDVTSWQPKLPPELDKGKDGT